MGAGRKLSASVVALSQAFRGCEGFQRLHVPSNLGGNLVPGNFQIVAGLEIHPKGGGVLEIACKAEGRCRR